MENSRGYQVSHRIFCGSVLVRLIPGLSRLLVRLWLLYIPVNTVSVTSGWGSLLPCINQQYRDLKVSCPTTIHGRGRNQTRQDLSYLSPVLCHQASRYPPTFMIKRLTEVSFSFGHIRSVVYVPLNKKNVYSKTSYLIMI